MCTVRWHVQPISSHRATVAWFFCSCPVLASNLLILTHQRENIDKLFLVNSYLPGCCIAKIANRRRHLFVLCTRVWKLSTAVQCCQNIDKLLQVNNDVFVAKGYEHIWASSGHRLKLAFCGCRTDVEARVYVRTVAMPLTSLQLEYSHFTLSTQLEYSHYKSCTQLETHSHYITSTQLENTVTTPLVHSQKTQSLHHQYTTRKHSHYTTSTQLENTVTTPLVHSQKTQSLHHQYPARKHSHYTTSIQLQYSHFTPNTQLEYTVTAPPINS